MNIIVGADSIEGETGFAGSSSEGADVTT